MYLNLYVPKLQYESGVVGFFRGHLGYTFASSALMDPITKGFVREIERFVSEAGVDLVTFPKGQRKDDVAQSRGSRATSRRSAAQGWRRGR